MIGSDDGAIYAWSEGTGGHLAGGTLPWKRKGGGITCIPVGDTSVSSSILFLKAPPFIPNWAVEFAIACVLCLVFGWFRVQAATMIEGRERTGDFGPWRVPYNISARGTFLFQKEILVCGGATISVWNWVKSWCTLGFDRDVINWLAASGGGNRVWF